MINPVIVSGEASETESEDESPYNVVVTTSKSIQGDVITGEDSESENENEDSIASATSALNESSINHIPIKKKLVQNYSSLLHQKLQESNAKFYQDQEVFCNNTVKDAEQNLIIINLELIKSQLTLQGAVTTLKSLGSNSLIIKNKLQSLLSSQFIPNINIHK